jgi:prophage regulatory protein
MADRILRRPAVEDMTGLRRSSIYGHISSGIFPPPVAIGDRAVGWPEREVMAVNAARIRGQSSDEIRALVAQLVADRAGLA